MKRITSISLLLGLGAMAFALGTMSKVFVDTYSVKADSNLGKAKCAVCHTKATGGALNPYGTDLKGALNGSKKLTSAMLKSVEGKDSDGDGRKNIDEIKADKMPGKKD